MNYSHATCFLRSRDSDHPAGNALTTVAVAQAKFVAPAPEVVLPRFDDYGAADDGVRANELHQAVLDVHRAAPRSIHLHVAQVARLWGGKKDKKVSVGQRRHLVEVEDRDGDDNDG